MAGRPRTRAKRAAAAAARLSDANQIIGGGPPTYDYAALERPPPVPDAPSDRQMLQQWSDAELESIERSVAERRVMLERAGPHPSKQIARKVLAYGVSGVPKDMVARALQMSEAEFELHYGADYEAGHVEANIRAAQNLMRIGTSSRDRVAVKATTEILNRRGGEEWRPPAQKVEVDDKRKGQGNIIDSSKLSPDDRQALKEILERTLLPPAKPGVAGFIDSETGEGEVQ